MNEEERPEEQADRMDQHSEAVGDRIEETRRDWEQKESAQDVPGAQPEREHEADVEDDQAEEE